MQKKRKQLIVKCRTCGEPSPWYDNPHRPFCSERCRLIDLGNWADGRYTVESLNPPDFSDDGDDGSHSTD